MEVNIKIDVPNNNIAEFFKFLAQPVQQGQSVIIPMPKLTPNMIQAPTTDTPPFPVPQVTADALIGGQTPSVLPAQETVTEAPKTLDDIRSIVMQLPPDSRLSIVQEVISRLGVKKLGDIPPERYDWAYANLQNSL